MAAQNENVAIFNPLVLPLPNWHPDGPDGDVDGYLIPFVMPARDAEHKANREAKVRVWPTPHGWRAQLLNCQNEPDTAEQARALAAAWIRAAEILENVTRPKPAPIPTVDELDDKGEPVVDCEIVDDDEDQDDEQIAAATQSDPTECECGHPRSEHGDGVVHTACCHELECACDEFIKAEP